MSRRIYFEDVEWTLSNQYSEEDDMSEYEKKLKAQAFALGFK